MEGLAVKALWEVFVVTTAEAEESVRELFGRVFTTSTAAAYTNEKTGVTRVSCYCAKLPDEKTDWRAELRAGLRLIKASGLDIAPGRIGVKAVAKEDWAESWKRHFKPMAFGTRLLVKPSWVKRRARKGQAVVVLDPGLSFGTGNHPTTAFCLSEVERCRGEGAQSFLDIGMGSGILAIAAAKLGYKPVRALDFDKEAVRVARENVTRNGVSHLVRVAREDVTKWPLKGARQYDFVCANLISDLLVAEKRRIVNRLGTGGRLVLAGILREEFPEVQRAYEQLGLGLVRCKIEGEWRSGAFEWK